MQQEQNTPGQLISFDGVDCSGKETQVHALVTRLKKTGRQVLHLQTPDYTTTSGRELKRRLQDRDGTWATTPWVIKMHLFADNRAEHRDEVLAALGAGGVVVYDRYVPSSLAFMAIEAQTSVPGTPTRQEVYDQVREYEYAHNSMPHEDISIFLDVPPVFSSQLLVRRKAQQAAGDEYTDQLAVQTRLYQEYEFLCASDPEHYLRLPCIRDGELLSIGEVSELIWHTLYPHG